MTACTRSHQPCDPQLQDWQRNYLLNPVTTFSLFDEFMEMSMWRRVGRAGAASHAGDPSALQ